MALIVPKPLEPFIVTMVLWNAA